MNNLYVITGPAVVGKSTISYEIGRRLEKLVYFRNTLVRRNYFSNYLNIKENKSFLIKFYENLLLENNNKLHSRDLIIEKLFDKNN